MTGTTLTTPSGSCLARRALAGILSLAALAALPAAAGAVVPGENGRIVFARGPDPGGDQLARLHLLPVFSSTGGGSVASPFTPLGGQYRHPSWSPDRTKVVVANGTPGSPATEEFDLFVYDFEAKSLTPLDGTEVGDGKSSDRPAWSPDGTRIAYEHQPADNSPERNIMIKTFGTQAAATPLTSGAPVDRKPAWSPDSQTVYYSQENASPQFADIVREPAGGGTVQSVQAASGIDEIQPSLSPDGSKMCLTFQAPNNTASADVVVTTLTGPGAGGIVDLSKNPGGADYNCVWSPDGRFVAYVTGAFSQGKLVMKPVDDPNSFPIELAQDPGANNFDGNPDWAPDGRPECPDNVNLTVLADNPVLLGMDCEDTGPDYERTAVREAPISDPANGTLGPFQIGDPSTVQYTPNPGFTGTDSFQFRGFDDYGFGSDTGTVNVTVVAPGTPLPGGGGGSGAIPKCAGKTATVIGTPGNDVIFGIGNDDVIVGLGGNDRIRGGAAADTMCGGSGRDLLVGLGGADRLSGNSGPDRVSGGRGNDRLSGGSAADRVSGGSGRDRLSGDRGNDRLSGGRGPDRLFGGAGRDRLSGGPSRDVCRGGKGRDRAASCERSSGL